MNELFEGLKSGLYEAIEYVSNVCRYSDRKTCHKCPLGDLNLCGTAPCSWDSDEINGLTDALVPMIQDLKHWEGK